MKRRQSPTGKRPNELQRELDAFEDLVRETFRIPRVEAAYAAFKLACVTQGLYLREQIEASPEFRAYVDVVHEQPDIARTMTRRVVEAGLLALFQVPIDEAEIYFKETLSIEGRFLWVLREEVDLEAMRAHLDAGQIWLRFDLIPSSKRMLALEWANRQLALIGKPPRPPGRPRGPDPEREAFIEKLVGLDPKIPLRDVHALAVQDGLRAGGFDDPRNQRTARSYRTEANRRRKSRQPLTQEP